MTIPTEAYNLIFVLLLVLLGIILWRMHVNETSFDLKDAICSWDSKHQKQIVSTSKSLLVGSFIVSSYYLIKNPSDVGYAAYMATWVANGGVATWRKVKETENATPAA
jgi:hypothetical protein